MRWWTWALLGAAVVLIWLLPQLAEARLLLLALFAAVITTISATQAWREIGFTSGALVTALTAFRTTFPMDARATFYQSVATQIDSVVAQVRYSVMTISSSCCSCDRASTRSR